MAKPLGARVAEERLRAERAEAEVRALTAQLDTAHTERDAARDELLEKWELYRACNGAEIYDVIIPKIRKLYMTLNAKARGDKNDCEGDPVQEWNRLVDLAVTAVVRWVVANRWAVNEHQRVEQVEKERDAALAEAVEIGAATADPTPQTDTDT